MAILKKDARAMFLAAIVVLAMVSSSPCHAQDYCGEILPCDDSACRYYCQKMGYNYPNPRCNTAKPGQGNCCCWRNIGNI
ncbi:hypothetical protein E2562_026735 [Oryza meyeriana var. granulata]|uniref:Uncharacterized protein n=1 Tax=Oryza meyeriana var. granulata TaxID=110450 RepID=A0A6G1EZ67_9ORYZ|nr:hypothetical protein E2562_026735 [Oryza meyeriana var. granulata]